MESRCQYQRESYSIAHWRRNNIRKQNEFHQAYEYFNECKSRFFANDAAFCQRSWGMSHDYEIAMQEGATLVRIGTAIFLDK